MLGASSTSAKRPSRVRARQLVPPPSASGFGGADAEAPLAINTAPRLLRRSLRRECRGGGVQRVLRTLLAEQRVLDLNLQRLRGGVVVRHLRAQDHVRQLRL